MNVIWSKHVQGPKTLYYSRKLRFDDLFAQQYRRLFRLDPEKKLNILEIGCGPGALAGALHRWYPKAQITALDRDSAFIQFGAEHEPGIKFLEGDAAALPFPDNCFDVTISNTVAEHVEPSQFYGEQLRVLKPGGVCLVMTSRKGINVPAGCIAAADEYEQAFWKKAEQYDDTIEKCAVGRYWMNESELPLAMTEQGFSDVRTGYALIDLTPDNPRYSRDFAHDIINEGRYGAVEAIEGVLHSMPEHFSLQEIQEMLLRTNRKYDKRLAQYDGGEKQWDTAVAVTMVVRGTKQTGSSPPG